MSNVPTSNARTLSVSPTASTAAYTAGDLVGGKLTLDLSFAKASNGDVVIDSVFATDLAKQSANMDLVLFLTDPSTATPFTDNAAFDIADADLTKVAAVIPITTHHTFNDNNISRAVNLDLGLKMAPDEATASLNMYGALVTRSTPTFAAADYSLKLTVRSA